MPKPPSVHARQSLSLSGGLAYASPTVPIAFFASNAYPILQGMYAKYFGLALTTIATVVLIARLFDAVTDPLIGYWSDRAYGCWGTRKPFVALGGGVFILSSWFLFVPPEVVTGRYFLGWFMAFYLGYTLFEIPHLSWANDISVSSVDKNKIYGYRGFCGYLGTLLFFVVPLLPIFETSEFTPQTLKWSVLVAGCLMVPALTICLIKVANGKQVLGSNNSYQFKQKNRPILTIVVGNRPFILLIMAFLFSGIGTGMFFGLSFLYADSYLDLGDEFALISLASLTVSILALPIWLLLAKYCQKSTVWWLATIAIVIGIFISGQLNSQSGSLAFLYCMTSIFTGYAAMIFVVPSLLADIVDYGTWKHGVNRTGTYFSIYTFTLKSNMAFGGALGFFIAGSYGFDPSAPSYAGDAAFGLRLALAWLPTPFILASMLFIALIPMNTHRHSILRRRLDAREAREDQFENHVQGS